MEVWIVMPDLFNLAEGVHSSILMYATREEAEKEWLGVERFRIVHTRMYFSDQLRGTFFGRKTANA